VDTRASEFWAYGKRCGLRIVWTVVSRKWTAGERAKRISALLIEDPPLADFLCSPALSRRCRDCGNARVGSIPTAGTRVVAGAQPTTARHFNPRSAHGK
jgi:hypothetical protein